MRLELLTEVYQAVVADAGLTALFDPEPVRLYYAMAKGDSPFPYVNYRLDLPGGTGVRTFRLWFSVYDFGPNAERASRIVERLERVVGRKRWLVGSGTEVEACRTYDPEGADAVETKNPEVHRFDFSVPGRLFDVGAIREYAE